jgi:hypothetical protein
METSVLRYMHGPYNREAQEIINSNASRIVSIGACMQNLRHVWKEKMVQSLDTKVSYS